MAIMRILINLITHRDSTTRHTQRVGSQESKQIQTLGKWLCLLGLTAVCVHSVYQPIAPDIECLRAVSTHSARLAQVHPTHSTHSADWKGHSDLALSELLIEKASLREPPSTGIEFFGTTALGERRITAYCSCSICCGTYALNRPVDSNGDTIVYGASGNRLIPGYSVASSTDIPLGTLVSIDGKEYRVDDRVAQWVTDEFGLTIDRYFDNHSDASAFGLQRMEVFELTK